MSDQKVLVAGAGKSGIAAAKLLLALGGEVILYDSNDRLDKNKLRARFDEDARITILLGELSRPGLVGVELAQSSFQKILHPEPVVFSAWTAGILAASAAVKLWMFWFNRRLSQYIGSAALAATAADSLSDAAGTAILLLGLLALTGRRTLAGGRLGLTVCGFTHFEYPPCQKMISMVCCFLAPGFLTGGVEGLPDFAGMPPLS